MRKASLKKELSYHEGAYSAIREIIYYMDELIIESCHYRENDKLWQLRDKVITMENISLTNINKLKEELH